MFFYNKDLLVKSSQIDWSTDMREILYREKEFYNRNYKTNHSKDYGHKMCSERDIGPLMSVKLCCGRRQ